MKMTTVRSGRPDPDEAGFQGRESGSERRHGIC
jgi:hypothetical protein